jgi:sialic acid synthase SpsE
MIKIIAEIGFNHEGDLKLAIEMIKAAAKAGTHAIKFQTYRAADLALPSSPHYQAIQSGVMNLDQHLELAKIAQGCGVEFLSTPFGPWAIDILEKVGVPAYKVASMDCTNKYLLGFIAETKKPIYLSTGMATLTEISETLNYLSEVKSGPVTLLHCMSLYPANAEDLNLAIIPYLKELFGVPVGYSDHYPGTKACLAAAMLGAEVVETHFTLDITKEGADHYHSVDAEMLRQLIADIELFQQMEGTKQGCYNRPDRKYATQYRRGVFTAKLLKKGDILRKEDLLLCRPTSQLRPEDMKWLEGRMMKQDIDAFHPIGRDVVKNNASL